jgi:predicted small lipoprotein YifL
MARLFRYMVLALVVAGVSACGTKGKLKSPSQIEALEAKKKAKAERDARRKAGEKVSADEELLVPQSAPELETTDKPAQAGK